MSRDSLKLYCVIPTFRASSTIVGVVKDALRFADAVIVVDDACPEDSHVFVTGELGSHNAVHVLRHERNGGVGAATKTGIAFAIEHGADIVVKLDADGQMDAAFIPSIRRLFTDDPALACAKGNRFFDARVLQLMPGVRLLGNALLSLMTKFGSGYWNLTDPTNGYLAFSVNALRYLPWRSFANSYFFEISVLCELGLRRLRIAELEMPTIYTPAPSSLSISRVLFEFPPRLWRMFLRRIAIQYFVFDLNIGSLCGIFGALLMLFGIAFGIYEWILGFATGVPRAAGIVMLAALPFLVGFQLLITAVLYDVQLSRRTEHHLLASYETLAESSVVPD